MTYLTVAAILLLLIAGIGLLVSARKTTPLHRAAAAGKLAKVRRLLDPGRPVDVRDAAGRTPLHVAAERGRVEVVGRLLPTGTDANARATNRDTPLKVATKNEWTGLADLLRERGGRE